jgi:hypothetical protein
MKLLLIIEAVLCLTFFGVLWLVFYMLGKK